MLTVSKLDITQVKGGSLVLVLSTYVSQISETMKMIKYCV